MQDADILRQLWAEMLGPQYAKDPAAIRAVEVLMKSPGWRAWEAHRLRAQAGILRGEAADFEEQARKVMGEPR